MNGLNSSEQQLFDTDSLCSSRSDLSDTEENSKDTVYLRQTIYNRSNLIKQLLQNRQNQRSQLQNKSNQQNSIQGNKSNLTLKGEQSFFQQLLQDKKVSLADVGRVYEKTNYGKWLNNIQQDEIYIDPTKKKKNSQILKDQALDQLIYNKAVRSQSNVSEYYNRKLSTMNEQLKVMKDKILKEQIQNLSKQMSAKGAVNGLKQMSLQIQNQKNIQDYQDEILTRCNRVDSYFNYKRNHNFLPKRSSTSFSFVNKKDGQQNKKSSSQNGNRAEENETEGDTQNKSTINANSIMLSQSQLMEEINQQKENINNYSQTKQTTEVSEFIPTYQDLKNSQQKSALHSPIPDDSLQDNRSIFSSLIKKKNSLYTATSNKQEQRSQSQKEKYLDADFTLSPIKENISKTSTGQRTKLPLLKNERSLPQKNIYQGLNKGKMINNLHTQQQQKDISLSPPPSVLQNPFPASPSLKSIQDKKGNRLAQQIERKINRIKKTQRMSSFQINENTPFQFGQSMMSFQDLQEKQQQFQSPILNKGVAQQFQSAANKPRFSRQQTFDRPSIQEITLGHANQLNMSQNLIKEEDENEDNFILGKKNCNESKRGSVNLLQNSYSLEKLKPNNQKFLKSCSILLSDDIQKQKEIIPQTQESNDKHNEIQLIRRDPLLKHKTGIISEQSQISQQHQINTSNSNSPQNRMRLNTEISPRSPNRVNFQSSDHKFQQSTLNVSDILNKSVQIRQRSTSNNNFNSPNMQHQTAQFLNEETHKLKEQLPDITNQLIRGIEEEYGKKESNDVLYLFYSQLQQIIQIEINDIEQNLKFKWDRTLNERKKMLTQKLIVMKGMSNLILSCCQIDEEIKSGNKQIHQMKKKEIGQIKNIDFYYDILQQHDFPEQEISKVILQMKQLEKIRDNASANQFVKDFRFNTVNNQMDSNMIIMQADRQDRAKRVKEFNQQRRISKMQKLQ